VPIRKAEKERLEHEEFEAKGFVPNLERLLLAVDESPNGKFAARLAGLIAGTRGLPITVLPLSAGGKSARHGNDEPEERDDAGEQAGETVKTAAETSDRGQDGEDKPVPVDVTVRKSDAPSETAIAREAKKGYDLLFVGVENVNAKGGALHADVKRIASAFDGPLAIVACKGDHLREPERSALRILVPVNGSETSRRAAELAVAMARACGCPITALYVVYGGGGSARRRPRLRARREQQAIMKDFVEIADRYDVAAKTTVQRDAPAGESILDEVKRAEHDLIVMGVSRRPGQEPSFGNTAAMVLEKSPVSIVFLAS
jgi:nucleotide-binding universal stress UspA family protein